MLYSTLAVLATTASLAIPPFAHLVHMRMHLPDRRVTVTLLNRNERFEDVKVNGRTYELARGQQITVHAPLGTLVLAGNRTPQHRTGDVLVSMTASVDHTSVALN